MKKNVFLVSTFTVATIILILIFQPILKQPNSYLYSKSGDALKSYFNFSYYLKYDEGIKHDGINYPYGDHLQYINSHPLYVQILKFVDLHIYPIADYGVAILNLSMIISLLLAMPFLFLILRYFKLPIWYAAIVSVILLFLTPQLDRIHGHFEMVYAFFIPMFWYLLLRYRENKKPVLWGTLLVLAGLVGGFTSAYYAAFYSIFLLGVLIADVWMHRRNLKAYLKPGIRLLILAIIPILVVKGLVSVTDWVDDRPNNPYGFYVYHANIFSIFLPFTSSLRNLTGNWINMDFQWEGRAYVGLPAVLMAISIIGSAIYRVITKKKGLSQSFFSDQTMNAYLIAATLILLFSMCFPFKWGFGFLLELLPPVKQFRALGRFSWIFYYVFTVYTAQFVYSLFHKLKQKGHPYTAILLLAFILFSWSVDAKTNIKRSTRGLFNKNDKLESSDIEYQDRFKEAGVSPAEFQAILFLPFASTCGDKLLFEHGMNAFSEAMKCSFHTGIPLLQSFSPRLSFTHSLSSIQMLADSCIRKTRLDDMNDKPLLLVCTKEQLTNHETWVQAHANTFWYDKHISLSILPVDVFKNSFENWERYAKQTSDSLSCNGGIYSNTSAEKLLFYDFENQKSDVAFTGKGAIYKRRGQVELFNQTFPKQFQNQEYELSFWLYFDTRHYDMPQPTLHEYDKNGKQIKRIKLNNREVHNVYGKWIRIKMDLQFEPDIRYQLIVKGKYITVDDLLIKQKNATVFIKSSGSFNLFNNFPLEK
ncbi:hypothetical protein [uncultured Sunxiuqinia sp.]|uniref:hypothetical protein n=1 Tax=uncultured Sunxiuqinia sp. TaxID=1573825 RepID=UPI002AA8F537|nr:hypothetical protein [uncultured Sunxiuqinia sp.]